MHYRATVTTDDGDEQTLGLAARNDVNARHILDVRFGEDGYTLESLEERPPEEFEAEPAGVEQSAPENADES